MLRSVGAVVGGFLAIFALSMGADGVLRSLLPSAFDSAGRVESTPVLLLIILYVGVFAVAGCYLTARLAPRRPMLHALILGACGLAFGVVGTIAGWNMAPAWYHLVSLALVLPYAWLGGQLRVLQMTRRLSLETPRSR